VSPNFARPGRGIWYDSGVATLGDGNQLEGVLAMKSLCTRQWVAAAAALAVTLPSFAAEPVQLKFGFPAPAASFINTQGMTPWIREVEQASEGTLQIKLYPGPTLGDFRNIYDRTLKGVVDIAFGIFGPLAGQFRQTAVASLPFEANSSTEAALGLWRLHQKGTIAKEFDRVKVLALFAFPSAHVHTKSPVKSLADLTGLKLSVSSRELGQIAVKLGAAPVSMPPPDVYQSISRGLVDGAIIPWTAVRTFKLLEVTNYHVEAPLGVSPAYVLMNKEAYARLPQKAKQAIDRFSGEAFSERLGKAADGAARAESEQAAAMSGQTVTGIPDREVEEWKSRIKSVVDAWASATPNGPEVLAAFREEVRRIRTGK
jgi:TRAP-type C4-dicarboxylate transport system substrate-binding protein